MNHKRGVSVLYLSYDGMTDPLGQSQVIPYLAGLTAKGYQVVLLSFEKPERYEILADHIQTVLGLHQISWVPLIYHKNPPVISTIFDYGRMYIKATALHRQYHFQIVHSRSYLSGMVGIRLKHKFGVRFVFDMRGFWADERVEGGLWNLNNPLFRLIFRFFKKQEKRMLSGADYTISLTRAAKKAVHSWKDIPNQPIPIEVIPCCVDMALFNPKKIVKEEQCDLRQKLGIEKKQFILTYLGSLGTWYMLEEMLMFFKHLLESRPDAVFLFVTKDPADAINPSLKRLNIPENKIILQSATREAVPLLLSISTASIFFIRPSFSKQASSATKMGEIMSMGIPFVTNKGWGDVEEIVTTSDYGVLLEDFTDEVYREKVKHLLNSINQYKELPATLKNFYDLKEGVANYESVYQKIIQA
ncbi:glycosyltransferase [Porifericola rhodea]|uniref:glycosyltransferase n=1 Tax=Porifericola rhodea TaxID=930972 RepID=UPI0026668FEC|nr:glycosyltransferase [Porifericola rhodea]WKN29787.1 glycosyltransferase [Porifericola rhodea]